ncbi:ion channel [Roseivirga sp. E12]|uniref:ion channel n=1 Tax=Roseivirga sp. E12 TaxID=2819237 RepID=UPI001ABC9406|nr:ion channel [Roseivirga sp. E12]MBO3698805.1 potassium transporter [Roseivirga sp. E12]
MSDKKKKSGKSEELGFGQKAYTKTTRLISQNGEFNVEKGGLNFWQSLDIYHELISMKWWNFVGLITLAFFFANLIFALLYYISGIDSIAGHEAKPGLDHFINSFYFSTQSITTVGFGKLYPNSNAASILAAIESFIGLLGFALATGLMFARFSRPGRNLIYSKKAIIAPYQGINGLMFRFANGNKNQLIEAEVDVVISYWYPQGNRRVFKGVNLERKKINFFSMSWTIVHPIDEKSPIFGWNQKDFEEKKVEIIIMFKAFDDTYVRQVYDRMSYVAEEVEWGKKFSPIYNDSKKGKILVDMEKLSETEAAQLN